ncbi:ATP-dependent nuclease [Priestia aryabhattai]
MHFYVEEYRGKTIRDKSYPCVVLTTDYWDDVSTAETLFHARYIDEKKNRTYLGDVKIMTTQSVITRNVIETEFYQLDDTYCSLGQELEYYETISELKDGTEILKGLRDIATNTSITEKFEDNHVFQVSLLRFSQAEKAFKEARKYFGSPQNNIDKVLEFTFKCKLDKATEEHEVQLDFVKSNLPYRINAFVGKNATGKTKVLTELASNLSGVRLKKDSFLPERPSFSKIITISYSAFDELYKPFDDKEIKKDAQGASLNNDKEIRKDENVLFSYVYCGLRTRKGILSLNDIENNFIKAFESIEKRKRVGKWKKIMKNVFEEEHFDLIETVIDAKLEKENPIEENLSSYLSSGQNILLSTMTEVIANVENDSLLLFDEPEIHLHPNAIANFMRMIYQILEEFDSYAVISTHSPIILQEIPSKYIRVFDRINNTPIIDTPILECFGENISNITNDVFEVREYESNYKTYFRKMAEEKSKEEIIELFEDLSFNALTYLNSIYHNKRKGLD